MVRPRRRRHLAPAPLAPPSAGLLQHLLRYPLLAIFALLPFDASTAYALLCSKGYAFPPSQPLDLQLLQRETAREGAAGRSRARLGGGVEGSCRGPMSLARNGSTCTNNGGHASADKKKRRRRHSSAPSALLDPQAAAALLAVAARTVGVDLYHHPAASLLFRSPTECRSLPFPLHCLLSCN